MAPSRKTPPPLPPRRDPGPPESDEGPSPLLERLIELGRWQEAIELALRELASDPESSARHLRVGHLALRLHDLDLAGRHLERAVALDPDSVEAFMGMSVLAFGKGDSGEAKRWIGEALKRQPENGAMWLVSARVYDGAGEPRRALEHAERARSLLPPDAEINEFIAMTRRALGERTPEESEARLTELEKALALEPENAGILHSIGHVLLHDLGRARDAEVFLRRALASDPGMETARRDLFRTLRRNDVVLLLLRLPIDYGVMQAVAFARWAWREKWPMIPFVLVAKYVFVLTLLVLMFWGIFCYPAIRLYEALTLREIRQRAGELGPRRGIGRALDRVPRGVRVSLFFVVTFLFWSGGALILASGKGEAVFMVLFSITLIAALVVSIGGFIFSLKRD